MATRFSRYMQGSANHRIAKRTTMRKQLSVKGRAFAGALKKKLNALITRDRIVQRSLHSMSARIGGRIKSARHVSSDSSFYLNLNFPAMECDIHNRSIEELVPQQEWDELFDSAFEAIGDTSVDIFEEN